MDIEITRVNYYEGQYLGPTDFTDEQAYHVAMRRRHHLAHHTWGIVRGLTLSVDPIDQEVSVAPGFAIDGYGRELVLPQKFVIPPSDFDLHGNAVAVFLEYDLVATDSSPQGTCDPAALATARQNASAGAVARQQLLVAADSLISDKSTLGLLGALQKVQALIEQVRARVLDPGTELNTRWRETLRVMRRPASGDFDPKAPPGVPAGDLNFPPTLTPPDDPAHEWPVYLGTVTRDPATLTYQADLTGLPYAGLRGEAVIAPSLDAWVRIGGETIDDPNKFEVYTRDGTVLPTTFKPPDPFAPTGLPTALRLAVTEDGRVDLAGNATLKDGNLTVVDGGIEFVAGDARAANTPFDLKFLPGLNSKDDIPQTGTSLVVVAVIGTTLYFRIFDPAGRVVIDTDESRLTALPGPLADLRKQLALGFDLQVVDWGYGTKVSTHGTSLVIVGTDSGGQLYIRTFDAAGSSDDHVEDPHPTPTRAGTVTTLKSQIPGLLTSLTDALKPSTLLEVQSILGKPLRELTAQDKDQIVDLVKSFVGYIPGVGRPLRPWQIYREKIKAPPAPAASNGAAPPNKTAAFDSDILFLEIPILDAAKVNAKSEFVVGSSKDKKFFPALTVSQDGTVTVHGNLVVGGTLTTVGKNATVAGAPTPGLQSLSAGLAAGAVSNSVLGAGTQTPDGDIQVLTRLIATNPSLVAQSLTASAGGRDAAATELAKGPDGTDAVVKALLSSDMGLLVDSLIKATGALKKFSTSLLGNIAGGSTPRMDEFAANFAANAIAPFVDSLITKSRFDDLAAAFTASAGATRMDKLLDAILDNTVVSGTAISASFVASLKRSTARLDLLVEALSDHTAVDAFVGSVLAKPAKNLLAKALADDTRMGTLVDALAAIPSPSGLDNLAAALASGPSTSPTRMDAFVGSFKDPNRMRSMVQSLLGTSAIDFLVDALITLEKMDALATSLNGSNSAGHVRMGPFIDGVIAADKFKAFAASLIDTNPTALPPTPPRIDDLVHALVGADGLDHLAAALALTPAGQPNRMDAFAAALASGPTTAPTRMDHFADSLLTNSAAPMGVLAASLSKDTSLAGGVSKHMSALVVALGTNPTGIPSPSSTPGMTALIKSLNANVSGATIAAIGGAGKPFVVEIGQATGTAGSKDPVYKPIAVLLKLQLNASFP